LEENIMQHYRIMSSLVLTAALLAPIAGYAAARQDRRRDEKIQVRVYDRTHKDYHVWNDREDHMYRQYLGDRHKAYRGYSRLSRTQQRTYWNWRHTRGD
jgi:hypothetical protein